MTRNFLLHDIGVEFGEGGIFLCRQNALHEIAQNGANVRKVDATLVTIVVPPLEENESDEPTAPTRTKAIKVALGVLPIH